MLNKSSSGVDGDKDRIVSRALYQEVAGRLRQRIFSHDLAPGTWIDEQAVAEAYGISRTPLREALKVLAGEGLVTLKPRRGRYVIEISRRDVEEIFPVLALLEGRCAYEASLKARPEDLRRLEAFHKQLESCAAKNDREAFFGVNQKFHEALHEIAGNRWMLQIINDLRKVMGVSPAITACCWKAAYRNRSTSTLVLWLPFGRAMPNAQKNTCVPICWSEAPLCPKFIPATVLRKNKSAYIRRCSDKSQDRLINRQQGFALFRDYFGRDTVLSVLRPYV